MQLTPDHFSLVQPLLNDGNAHWPLLESVLQRDLSGWVFVDNPQRIQSAFVLSRMGWAYFLGTEDCGDFGLEVMNVIKQRQPGSIIWFGASGHWNTLVKTHVTADLQDFPRYRFRFHPDRFRASDEPAPVEIHPIDAASLDTVLAKYYANGSLWDDPSNFLSRGFGFTIRDQNEIVSVALSASVTETDAEIDIHTDETHRRKGYAEALSRAFIRACLDRGLLPKWDCSCQNAASAALAEKLGFTVHSQYPLSFITL